MVPTAAPDGEEARPRIGPRYGLVADDGPEGKWARSDDGSAALITRLEALLPGAVPPRHRLVWLDDGTSVDGPLPRAARAAGWETHRVVPYAPAADAEPVDARGVLVLDGSPEHRAAALAAAAETVAHNCDVLVAVGDAWAEPLAGAIDQALDLGVPVLWLEAPQAPARLLLDRGWRVSREPPPSGDAASEGLRRTVLDAPEPSAQRGPEADRLLLQARQLPSRRIWRAHRRAMDLLWRAPSANAHAGTSGGPPPGSLPEQPAAYWSALYEPADALANAYADRYRSSYVLVLLLAALALTLAVSGLALPGNPPEGDRGSPQAALGLFPLLIGLLEFACLAGIIALVRANTRLDWRSQLILCRLFAELCRKQGALAFLGRSLPASRIARMAAEGEMGWVGRRFVEAVRAAPLPSGRLAGTGLATARDAAAAVLLRGQREYHHARAEAEKRREARLVQLGGWAFALTVTCVAIKLGLLLVEREGAAEAFGLVAALLPAAAAALFGLRAYAELELLVQQSEGMLTVLDEAQGSLDRVDTRLPLASQRIGDVLEQAAEAMLADVQGWIQVSRVKAVEAG